MSTSAESYDTWIIRMGLNQPNEELALEHLKVYCAGETIGDGKTFPFGTATYCAEATASISAALAANSDAYIGFRANAMSHLVLLAQLYPQVNYSIDTLKEILATDGDNSYAWDAQVNLALIVAKDLDLWEQVKEEILAMIYRICGHRHITIESFNNIHANYLRALKALQEELRGG